jgi:hypothetical protein
MDTPKIVTAPKAILAPISFNPSVRCFIRLAPHRTAGAEITKERLGAEETYG